MIIFVVIIIIIFSWHQDPALGHLSFTIARFTVALYPAAFEASPSAVPVAVALVGAFSAELLFDGVLQMVDGAEIWVLSLPLQALTSPPAPVPITVSLVSAFLATELFFDRVLLKTALLLVDTDTEV